MLSKLDCKQAPRIPPCKMGEYVQDKALNTNEIDIEKTIDALYIRLNHNGTGHYLFKLKTKERMLVRKVIPAHMPELILNISVKQPWHRLQIQ